jgi:hypothetical protein
VFKDSTYKNQGKRAIAGPLPSCLLFLLLAGPHPRSLALGGFAPRAGRRRFPLSLVPFPFCLLLFSTQRFAELVHALSELDELRADGGIDFNRRGPRRTYGSRR